MLFMNKKNTKIHLVLSILLFVFVCGAIFFSLKILNSFTSKIYVLNKTILNIKSESENEAKIKSELENYAAAIESVDNHIITKENDVPKIIENIESLGNKLGLDIKIDNISIPGAQPGKAGSPATTDDIENSKKNSITGVVNSIPKNPSKPIIVDMATNGSFDKLFKFMYLIENNDYIMNIQSYKIEQVYVNSSSDGQTYSPVLQNIDPNKKMTWLLNIKLVVNTAIK